MTRDDIIRMAREAGIQTVLPAPKGQVEALADFAALVAAAERQECLELAKKYGDHWTADAIRAKGKE